MRLLDLEPHFIKLTGQDGSSMEVGTIQEADGVLFLCPQCVKTKGKKTGVETMMCWQPHVPQTVTPRPGRWKLQGTGLQDLTLSGYFPDGSKATDSVLSQWSNGPGTPLRTHAHYFIRNGEIIFA